MSVHSLNCLSVSLSLSVSVSLSVYLSVCLSLFLPDFLYVSPSIYPSVFLSVPLSVASCLSIGATSDLSLICLQKHENEYSIYLLTLSPPNKLSSSSTNTGHLQQDEVYCQGCAKGEMRNKSESMYSVRFKNMRRS